MLAFLNERIFGWLLPLSLLLSGGYLIAFLGLRPIRGIGCLMRRGGGKGEALRHMVTALAGTLGVGNITGVAAAISGGGAGALFWMWISGLAAMAVKYAETVLACLYRRWDEKGIAHGSAASTMEIGAGWRKTAWLFSVLLLIGGITVGNLTQTGAAAETAKAFFGIPPLACGLLLCLLFCLAVRRGGEGIVRFANMLIPPLTLVYVIFALAVILPQAGRLPDILADIVHSAFTPRAGISGIGGYLLMSSLRLGTSRGLLSNEAGCGTAATAHAASSAEPAEQGLYGIFEVLVDTHLLCTLTGLVILLAGSEAADYEGTELAIRAFSLRLGGWVEGPLALSVMLYALASSVAWCYYGIEAIWYLSKGKAADGWYRLLSGLSCIVGSLLPMSVIFGWSDLTVAVMTLINLTCILRLSGRVREQADGYLAKKRRC